jgi:hypothetical protein
MAPFLDPTRTAVELLRRSVAKLAWNPERPNSLTACYENRVQRADGFARSGGFLLEFDGITEALQAMNQVSSQVMFVEFVEVEIP